MSINIDKDRATVQKWYFKLLMDCLKVIVCITGYQMENGVNLILWNRVTEKFQSTEKLPNIF